MARPPRSGDPLSDADIALGSTPPAETSMRSASGTTNGSGPTGAPNSPFGTPGPIIENPGWTGLARNWPTQGDPAFQHPAKPLDDVKALQARAKIITRDVPNVVIQLGWSVSQVRAALQDLTVGLFDTPSQLLDNIQGDSRVQSAMRSRSGGLLGRPVRFRPAAHSNKALAKKACARWEKHWPQMHAEPALLDILETSAGLGFAYAQIVWDTAGDEWKPYLKTFAPRYSWYHWVWRLHIAVTLDGMYPITGGDGHWIMHAPYGEYRGWMRSSMWALAQWWLARQYALRDWARYCERHGFPILLADTPFGADPDDITSYQGQLSQLGQESVLQLPGSVDLNQFGKYDLRYLEPSGSNWEAFQQLIEQCNTELTLTLLGQNLTTQVKEGSLAAARVHADVRQAILEADARALSKTIHNQILRPWAMLNFGDADLAPRVSWDVRPQEDLQAKAATFSAFATGLGAMKTAGLEVQNIQEFARRFGIVGLEVKDIPPPPPPPAPGGAPGAFGKPGASSPQAAPEKPVAEQPDASKRLPGSK